MPLSFKEVRDAWQYAQQDNPSLFGKMDLPSFARYANKATGGSDFAAGDTSTVGSYAKRASAGLDELLAPVAEKTGQAFEGLGSLISPRVGEISGEVGKGLPRSAIDALTTAAGIAATPVAPEIGIPLASFGLGSSFSKGYEETGRPLVGAIQAGVNAALPAAGGLGAKLSVPVSKAVGSVLGNVGERATEFGAEQLGVLGANEAARGASNLAQGQPWGNPLSEENVVSNVAGTLPFLPFHAPTLARGYKVEGGVPKPSSLVDLFSGTEAPVKSLADFSRLQEAQGQVQRTGQSIDQVTQALDQGDRTVKTQARVEAADLPFVEQATVKAPEENPIIRVTAQTKTGTQSYEMPYEAFKALGIPKEQILSAETVGSVGPDQLRKVAALVPLPPTSPMKFEPPAKVEPIELSHEYLTRVLTKLEELGAKPDQLGLVAERNIGKGVGFDIQAAKDAAFRDMLGVAGKRLGMGEALAVPDETATIKGLTSFFDTLMQQRGYQPDVARRLATVAHTMAASLGQFNTIVLPTGSKQDFFMPLTKGKDGKLVVLSYQPTFNRPAQDMAHTLWKVGHELTHGWEHDVTNSQGDARINKVYTDANEVFKSYTPEERSQIASAMYHSIFPTSMAGPDVGTYQVGSKTPQNDLVTTLRGLEERKRVYKDGDDGVREFMADVTGMLAMGVASPSKNTKGLQSIKELMQFSEPRVQDFLAQSFTDIGAVLHSNEGLLQGLWQGDDKELQAKAEPVEVAMKAVAEALKENLNSDKAKRYLSTIAANFERNAYSPDVDYRKLQEVFAQANALMFKDYEPGKVQEFKGFGDLVSEWGKKLFDKSAWEKETGIQMGYLDKITPMGQLVHKYPIWSPVVDLGTSFQNHATEISKKMWSPFFEQSGSGKIDEKLISRLADPSSPLQEPFSKLRLLQNVEQRSFNEQEFQKYAGGLSKEDQLLLRRGMSAGDQQAVTAQVTKASGEAQRIKSFFAQIVMHNKDLFPAGIDTKQAETIGELYFNHAINGELQHPLLQQLPPKVNSLLYDFGQTAKKQFEDTKAVLMGKDGKGKPWWTTEVRLGDYMVGWKDEKGQSGVKGFYSQKEALAFVDGLRKQGIEPKAWNKTDKQHMFAGVDRELLERYTDADEVYFKKLLDAMPGLTDEQKASVRDTFSPGDGAFRMMTPPSMLERKLLPGREDLNMMAGMMHYVDSTALGEAKQFVKSKMGLVLHTPEMKENPAVQAEARNYLNNIINPTGREFSALKGFVFFNYLGLSIPTWFTEPTQAFVAHVPYLISKGAGYLEANKLVAKAMTKAARYAFGKLDEVGQDADLIKALKQFQNEGVIGQGFVADMLAAEDVNTLNLRRLARGDSKMLSASDLVKKPMYWLMKSAKQFYRIPSELTSRAAAISSYEFARGKGMSHDEAITFTKEAVRSTAYTGGRAVRPLAIGYMGKAQGVGGLMYSLQSYTYNTIAMMARLGKESLSKTPMSSIDQSHARKAFGAMLGAQVVLGGAMGLPFTAAALGLVEQLFPEAELKKGLRESVAGLAGDDQEMGAMVADAALNGLLNTGPVDFGSRFQLGNVFGVDPYQGFQWSNLAGPVANIAANWTKAVGDLSTGEFGQAARRVAPTGLRGLTDLATNNWQERDSKGNLLFDPTAGQMAARIAGFRSKQLAQHSEAQSILARDEKIAGEKLQRFHEELAGRLLQGDAGGVRDALVRHQQELPGYDARTGAQQVAQLAQNKVVPQDLTRSGSRVTAQGRAALASSYAGQGRGQSSEVDRLLQRSQLEQLMNIPGTGVPSKGALSQAALLDQVLKQHPSLTVKQAQVMVEQAMRPMVGRVR